MTFYFKFYFASKLILNHYNECLLQLFFMEFPVYRKYAHNRTFFKINTEKDFEEINIIGNSYLLRRFEVKIFPDRVFIQDMIENKLNYWVVSSREEYETKKSFCLNNLKPL